jgi:hypothetical protein
VYACRRAFRLLLTAAAAAALVPARAAAQAAPATPGCPAPEHRQFDFWVGHWDVRMPDGRLAGTNHIERALGGCALVERWTGAGPSRGLSINFYDAAAGRWRQSWIDNQGQPLLLAGGLRDGRMVLESALPDSAGRGGAAPAARQRVTWTPLPGGDVRQLWESSTDGGATWRAVFDGRYTRRP